MADNAKTPTRVRRSLRPGDMSPRMLLVLGVSLALALMAMVALLAFFYATHSPNNL